MVGDVLGSAVDLVNGTGDTASLSTIATGALLGELQANAAEFANNGWRQEGVPTIASLAISDVALNADPPSMKIQVCLDSSSVRIFDDSDLPLDNAGTPARSLNIYVMKFIDNKWILSEHTFPDNADC
ncbi:hypothetical protein EH165_03450 [Nakamurella antarctica]|uniref:Mce-associated membrane protein n=1 Tax=Nakamurella antarctica TaxID=1902245 RepID=A0A3G8ZS62_9ACTN|nr:hypothetical protein [Nakamurella antarctica]AZI57354.1 hypothetical protein EH165_03450 [Nakamurella antarctica]